jgi:hypothetical protein
MNLIIYEPNNGVVKEVQPNGIGKFYKGTNSVNFQAYRLLCG